MTYRAMAFMGFPDYISKDYTTITSPGTVPSTLPLTHLKTEEPSEVTRILSLDPTKTQITFTPGGTEVDISGFALVNHNLSPGSQYRFIGFNDATTTSWTYQQLAPNAIASSSNVSGAVTNIDEAIESPDALAMEPTNKTLPMTVRLSFPTPASTPDAVTTVQGLAFVVRAQIAYVGAGATSPITYPTINCNLRQSGSPIVITLGRRAVQTAAPGQVFIFPFRADYLTNPSGVDIELEILTTPGVSASGSSYVQIESARLYYDNLITSMSGYVASTEWLDVAPGYTEDVPTASDHHFPETTWSDIQNLILLIRSDQSNHDASLRFSDGGTLYNGLAIPDSFVQIGGVEAGGARFLEYGILSPGPLAGPQTTEMGGTSLIGQTYAADSFQGRVTEPMALHVTREEAQWLQREIGWKKGLSRAFYVAMEPDIDPEWQMFTAFWATLAEDLSLPRMIGAYEADGTMRMEIIIKLREKL